MRNISVILAGSMLGLSSAIGRLGEQACSTAYILPNIPQKPKENWQGQGKRRKPKMK
ncbi:hypothetical protein [Acinetobacter phage HFM1]|nr:hypothetical protein [Acinetobacter phage HFM1]